MKRVFRLFLLLGLVEGVLADDALVAYGNGLVSPNAVMPPEGTFLLIRNGGALCAIRFLEIWRGNDAKQPTSFYSGDETVRARYMWYEGKKIKDKWSIHPPQTDGVGEVVKEASIGIGRFAFGGGEHHINCGNIRVKWSPPAHVYFYQYDFKDEGNEIALTQHAKFEDIEPNDPALHWLRIDETRQSYTITVQ